MFDNVWTFVWYMGAMAIIVPLGLILFKALFQFIGIELFNTDFFADPKQKIRKIETEAKMRQVLEYTRQVLGEIPDRDLTPEIQQSINSANELIADILDHRSGSNER